MVKLIIITLRLLIQSELQNDGRLQRVYDRLACLRFVKGCRMSFHWLEHSPLKTAGYGASVPQPAVTTYNDVRPITYLGSWLPPNPHLTDHYVFYIIKGAFVSRIIQSVLREHNASALSQLQGGMLSMLLTWN